MEKEDKSEKMDIMEDGEVNLEILTAFEIMTCLLKKDQRKKGEDEDVANLVPKYLHAPCQSTDQSIRQLLCDVCGGILGSKLALKRHLISHHMNPRPGRTIRKRVSIILPKEPSEGNQNNCQISSCSSSFACNHESSSPVQITNANNQLSEPMQEVISSSNIDFTESLPAAKIESPVISTLDIETDGSKLENSFLTSFTEADSSTNSKKSVFCDKCGKGFANKYYLNTHKFYHTGVRPFGCKHCGKTFKTKGQMQSHERRHIKEEVTKLIVNGTSDHSSSFNNQGLLSSSSQITDINNRLSDSTQEITTNPVTEYTELLTKVEMESSVLSTFIEANHVECESSSILNSPEPDSSSNSKKTVFCDICRKGFANKYSLATHKAHHMGNQPFSCLHCNKCFTTKAQVETHERRHMEDYEIDEKKESGSEEKPNRCKKEVCDLCGESFINKYVLATHKKLHSGIRPFTCTICSKTFKSKGQVKAHENRHKKM